MTSGLGTEPENGSPSSGPLFFQSDEGDFRIGLRTGDWGIFQFPVFPVTQWLPEYGIIPYAFLRI